MKKFRAALAVAIVALIMAGCMGSSDTTVYSPTENSIFITRAGEVSSALIETYEQGEYNQDELKAYVEEAVTAYNTSVMADKAAGDTKQPVTVSSCTVGNGKAIVVFDYSKISDMLKFNEQEEGGLDISSIDVMTIADAVLSGKLTDLSMNKPDGSKVSQAEVSQKSKLYITTIEGNCVIQTEGKIEYVSEGVTVIDKYTAKTPGGKSYVVFK